MTLHPEDANAIGPPERGRGHRDGPPPAQRPAADHSSESAEGAEPAHRPGQVIDTLFVCLLRICREFGRPISESDIRALCPVPDQGMMLETFLQAADRLGYRVRRVTLNKKNLRLLPTPFVALGEPESGAVLVTGRTGERLTIFAPTEGEISEIAISDAAALGDAALLVAPEPAAEASKPWRGMVVTKVRGIFVELAVASLVINLFALISPLFVMTVYNKVIGQRALDTLQVLAIGMLFLYAFDLILRVVRGYISTHTGARMDALLGGEAVHRLVNLPYRHFETTPTGLISERLRQLETIRQFFTSQMPLTIIDLAFVFVFIAALWYLNMWMAVIVLGAAPIFIAMSAAFHRAQKKLVEENFAALAAKTSTLAETVANALTVKSLNLEAEIEKRWSSRLALSAWTGFRSNNIANQISVYGTILQQVVGLMVVVVGAILVTEYKAMTVGSLIAANILASRALAPMRQVVGAWSQLQEVRAAFRRLDDFMNEAPECEPGTLLPLSQIQGKVVLENVSFAYADDQPPVIRNIDLTIKAGSVICIMGPSGSGKSTVAKLLQGLYIPVTGRILIDDTDIAHVSTPSMRRQIGVVPQEVQLFAGTVRDNIAIGTPAADPQRVVAAAKFVGAHDFIQKLPKGYDTVLSERGGGLSMGQRQLLCIARALMRNPRMLILDEPTSALDSVSEEKFLRNLRLLAKNRTVIIISHRLAPASIADNVALLVDGTIVGQGPPSEIAKMTREAMSRPNGDRPAEEEQASDEPESDLEADELKRSHKADYRTGSVYGRTG